MSSVGSVWHWVGFLSLVLFLLSLDLFVFQRKSHAVSAKEALSWSAFWILLAICFGGLVYKWFGPRLAMEYYAGYVIEKALSVDNLFVFLVIFGYFRVPKELQHRVLYWGILGALVLRAVFILAGAALVQQFHFVLYLFGAFLVFTGIRLLFGNDKEADPSQGIVIVTIQKWIPTTSDYRGNSFFVREGGRWLATPLFLVLIVIETTDLVFAVDSIPAIFGISRDPFIVFSSNIFAILGLRSLYFALAIVMEKFHYLKVALAFVLVFVGVKMLIAELYKVPIGVSLSLILGLLVGSALLSVLRPPRPAVEESSGPD